MRDARLEEVFSNDARDELFDRFEAIWRGDTTGSAQHAFLHNDDGRLAPIHVRLCRVVLGNEPFLGLVMRQENELSVSSEQRSDRRDPLTGLPDRTFLQHRLTLLLEGDRTADRQCAVLFVDLNNFKQINDRYGHLLGDRVLCEVAGRLTSCVREGDYVTRYGGDEFVVLLQNVMGSDEIEPVVERVRSALVDPIVLPEGRFMLSLSVGVAVVEPHHLSPEDVLSEADRGMYAAKRAAV
jgi:diguanylate cyclase (GGDEF)-like protein